MGGDDPFASAGGFRLTGASRHTYQLAWRRFLGFLNLQESTALELDPAQRLTHDRVRAFVIHLAATNIPTTVARLIYSLYCAARVMLPEHEWTWLKAIAQRLRATAPTRGNTGPIITSVQLLELGQQLLDESKPAEGTPFSKTDALRYRDGLIFAFLAFVPIRHGNLTALEIGRHLVREGDRWFVVISPEEAKTGTSIEFPILGVLDHYITFYLDVVRARLLPATTCTALWINSKGGPLSYLSIGRIISRHAKNRLGIHFTPHDARDAAATTWALSAPDQIGVARDLLAHRDLRTTTKHYNRARGIEASRTYSQIIAAKRKKAKSKQLSLDRDRRYQG